MSAGPTKVALRSVRNHAKRTDNATEALHRAIYGANSEGASLREIAEESGMSHTQVSRILRAETAKRE